jgi:16S rRNA (guanine966-N2)-methyltransferase
MRIDAGLIKGRKVPLPKGAEVRPTSDKVKQALFNILGPRVQGARVLDLFCGAGSLGLEALSRGARSVYFLDKDARCLDSVKAFWQKAALEGMGEAFFLKGDAFGSLAKLASQGICFDLVFADPPYGLGLGSSVLQSRELVAILAPEAASQVVLEHSREELLTPGVGLELSQSRRYGSTALSFFRRPSR